MENEQSLKDTIRTLLENSELSDDVQEIEEDEVEENGPIILKVAGALAPRDTVVRLARAIMLSLQEHGVAVLKAIGPPAIANKDKAFIKAREWLQGWTIGYDLAMTCCHKKINIDGKYLTAEETRIFAIPSKFVK